MKLKVEWTLEDVIDDYAEYSYIEMYFAYVDIDNDDMFYEPSLNINEDLFKFLDLDISNVPNKR
jgi:hypothetical protein